jgi:hypothetical protein
MRRFFSYEPVNTSINTQNTGTVSHDAASSPGDNEIKQSNFMAVKKARFYRR